LLVALADQASRAVRRALQRSRGLVRSSLPVRVGVAGGWIACCVGAAAFRRLPMAARFSLNSLKSIESFAASLFPPDLDPVFLRSIGRAVVETLSMSILGTAIAAVLGFLLATAAAARVHFGDEAHALGTTRSEWVVVNGVSWVARALLNLGRTLPELLWALIFIFVVGLGPFAGAVALGLHTAGVLGRLYSEALEEVPSGPLLALRGAGAPRPGAAAFAVLPQAFTQLVAYTLYRWEVN